MTLWKEQCDAALGIRDDFGIEKALGYLIGEKFLNFLEDARSNVEARLSLQDFAERIRQDWTQSELQGYFKNVTRVGALGHVASDETYRMYVERGVVDDTPADYAQQMLLLEQARKILQVA